MDESRIENCLSAVVTGFQFTTKEINGSLVNGLMIYFSYERLGVVGSCVGWLFLDMDVRDNYLDRDGAFKFLPGSVITLDHFDYPDYFIF